MLNRTHVLICLPTHTFIQQNMKQHAIYILHFIQHYPERMFSLPDSHFHPNFCQSEFSHPTRPRQFMLTIVFFLKL